MFNGDFRRKPTVNIRGSGESERKDQLIERARQERLKRSENRLKNASAIKVQSWFRGHRERRRLRRILREEFDRLRSSSVVGGSATTMTTTILVKERLAACLILFRRDAANADLGQDEDRVNWFCQLMVVERAQVLEAMKVEEDKAEERRWAHRVSRLVLLALQYMSRASSDRSISRPLRFVQVYADYDQRPSQLRFLVENGYYRCLRRICDLRIPPIIEESSKAPTPLAEAVFDMMAKPLSLVCSEGDLASTSDSAMSLSDLILLKFTEAILSQCFSEQVELFVIPALTGRSEFPHTEWTRVLSRFSSKLVGSPWLLYSFLKLSQGTYYESISLMSEEVLRYLEVLGWLTSSVAHLKNVLKVPALSLNAEGKEPGEDSDDEANEDDNEYEKTGRLDIDTSRDPALPMDCSDVTALGHFKATSDLESLRIIARKALELLNSETFVRPLLLTTELFHDPQIIRALCLLGHNLLLMHNLALNSFRLLYTLAFRPSFLHNLWYLILETKRPGLVGNTAVPLLTVISRGVRTTAAERDAIVPLLAVFSSLFGYLLVTIHDTEFYGDDRSSSAPSSSASAAPVPSPSGSAVKTTSVARSKDWMPFSLEELVQMSLALRDVAIGLVELAFPESRPNVRNDYQVAVRSVRNSAHEMSCNSTDTQVWSHLFRNTVILLRQLYNRDTRRQFCPDEHWINDRITLPVDRASDLSLGRSRIRQYRPFTGLRVFTREELAEEGPPLSAKEVRLATVLRELPYVISFSQRVMVFNNLIQRDKAEHQGDQVHFLQGHQIHVSIRRSYLYEDAFEKLSPDNEPNMKLKMRVNYKNTAGLTEAGIDGGGLFREFMAELLETAFDPNRGFFRSTTDQRLYPNPSVQFFEPNYVQHYYFIGRMLGKALYENMLVELPLASFFLSKLLGQGSINVDIDHLYSLDPELYKNLLYLKNYEGDVKDLELDFTILTSEVGKMVVDELKPGGASIVVNNENRIEYIHLVADYRLNKQIRAQCNAFRNGMSDVINLDWLRMFSHRELQTLISGADHNIDIDELRSATTYGNGFSDTHPTVEIFWDVASSFSEKQKRKLLKFVTSCSRPPLLGFKELIPPFCIQNAGQDPDRLPTASTCMNLLKLPEFKDQKTLKTKLLYAVESASGFELS